MSSEHATYKLRAELRGHDEDVSITKQGTQIIEVLAHVLNSPHAESPHLFVNMNLDY